MTIRSLLARARGFAARRRPPEACAPHDRIADPFSRAAAPSPAACRDIDRALAEAGIRLLPRPFTTALAIISDIDASRRADYEAYRSLLVDRLGLDFGDSFFFASKSRDGSGNEISLSCYRYDGDTEDLEGERDRSLILSFLEIVREVHRGNVSHPHCFSSFGPHFGLLRDRADEPARVTFDVASADGAILRMPFTAVRIVGVAARLREATVTVHGKTGTAHATQPVPRAGARDDVWFELRGEAGARPTVDEVSHVTIDAAPADVRQAYLCGLRRDEILAMVEHLRGAWGFRSSTWVDHNARGFLTASAERNRVRENRAAFDGPDVVPLFGRICAGDLDYSVLADDPRSPAYVLPELVERYQLQYVNPSGLSGEADRIFHPAELLAPAFGRDGTAIRVARRSYPRLPTVEGEPPELERNMGTLSFAARLSTLLERLPDARDRAWPFYTHLGNIRPQPAVTADPYFPLEPLLALQDTVIGRRGRHGPRVWFTTANTLYTYADVISSVAPHVTRPGRDRIEITSWTDAHDGRPRPRSVESLHGLTFRVDDAAAAEVRLDGTPVPLLVRSAADSREGASVTVVGRGASRTLLDDVDSIGRRRGAFLESLDLTPCDGRVEWRTAADAHHGRAYTRFVLEADGMTSFSQPGRGRGLSAAQYLAFALRRSAPDTACTVVLETESGARFHFGAPLPPSGAAARAEAVLADHDAWQPVVCAFCALAWADDGSTPDDTTSEAVPAETPIFEPPLPSHPLAWIHYVVGGRAGQSVDIDQVELIRPAGIDWHDTADCIVGGRAPAAATVTLRDVDTGTARTTTTDPVGMFAFRGVARGSIVELSGLTDEGRALRCRAGARFDAWYHDLDHVLEPDDAL